MTPKSSLDSKPDEQDRMQSDWLEINNMLNLYYEPSYFQMSIIITINLPLNTTGYELNFSQLPVLLFGSTDIQMAFLSIYV
jgi:hypothetical protein